MFVVLVSICRFTIDVLQSLADKSHRPHHHPNEHTPEELKLITDMRKRNTNAGLAVFWVKLRQRGYSRSITVEWYNINRVDKHPKI